MLKLSKQLTDKIKERWLNIWHSKLTDGADAHVSMWVEAITETLSKAGYDWLPADLLAEERKLADEGLQEEYVDALVAITKATPENVMALVTATSEERLKAVRTVRAYQKEKISNLQGGYDA